MVVGVNDVPEAVVSNGKGKRVAGARAVGLVVGCNEREVTASRSSE